MRKLGLVALAVFTIGAAALSDPASPEITTLHSAALQEAPLEPPLTYLRDCAWCHAADGSGTPRAPSLIGVGAASADFMLSSGRMPIHLGEEMRRGPPAYPREEIDEIVRFVASLGPGPEIPVLDLERGDLGRGALLYMENCAACHASSGIGAALTQGRTAPPMHPPTPLEIAEAIRIGGTGRLGIMPPFGPEALDDDDLNSLVRYVVYLQQPEQPGGAALGRIGPVAEGFVAWVVGMGLLLAAAIWITKSD